MLIVILNCGLVFMTMVVNFYKKADGNENDLLEPWYDMDVVYITVNKDGNGIILEVA